jgi:hypothetical protein
LDFIFLIVFVSIVYDPSSGRTIYNVSASTAAGACPYVNQTQPAVSTTAATNGDDCNLLIYVIYLLKTHFL